MCGRGLTRPSGLRPKLCTTEGKTSEKAAQGTAGRFAHSMQAEASRIYPGRLACRRVKQGRRSTTAPAVMGMPGGTPLAMPPAGGRKSPPAAFPPELRSDIKRPDNAAQLRQTRNDQVQGNLGASHAETRGGRSQNGIDPRRQGKI